MKELVEDAVASIVCLVESKLDVANQFDILQILGPRFDGFIFLPAVHTCGGIIFAWQSSSVQVQSYRIDSFSVSAHISLVNGASWWHTAHFSVWSHTGGRQDCIPRRITLS